MSNKRHSKRVAKRVTKTLGKGFCVVKKSSTSLTGYEKSVIAMPSNVVSQSSDAKEFEDSTMLGKFLDFLTQDIIDNPSKLVPYTEEMSSKARSLITGVTLDDKFYDS